MHHERWFPFRSMIATADNLTEISTATPRALKLQASNPQDLQKAAAIIKAGGVAVLPFNGVFGLFGDVDNKEAADRINIIKDRKDKSLITVIPPDFAHELVDFDRVVHPRHKISELWNRLHAMGIILPANDSVLSHLITNGTLVNIWTNYPPFIIIMDHFRDLGGRGFVGTSANRREKPTEYDPYEVWDEFKNDVDVVVQDNFKRLRRDRRELSSFIRNTWDWISFYRIDRRGSTSILDLTDTEPRLHRAGNVDEEEIKGMLKELKLPRLTKGRDVIVVRRKS